jgi:hypothetical protein
MNTPSVAEQLRTMRGHALPHPQKQERAGPTPLKRTPMGTEKRHLYQTEREFQRQVEDYASLMGWYAWHDNLPMRSKAGFPDCLFLAERAVWAELKVYHSNGRRGRVMPEQENFHRMLRDAGQEVHVWFNDDDGWADIYRVLGRGTA